MLDDVQPITQAHHQFAFAQAADHHIVDDAALRQAQASSQVHPSQLHRHTRGHSTIAKLLKQFMKWQQVGIQG